MLAVSAASILLNWRNFPDIFRKQSGRRLWLETKLLQFLRMIYTNLVQRKFSFCIDTGEAQPRLYFGNNFKIYDRGCG